MLAERDDASAANWLSGDERAQQLVGGRTARASLRGEQLQDDGPIRMRARCQEASSSAAAHEDANNGTSTIGTIGRMYLIVTPPADVRL